MPIIYAFVLQNVDVLIGESLVHTADSTELAAHTTGVGVVILWHTTVADRFGCSRIKCAGILCIPVQDTSGIRHLIIDISGTRNTLAMSAA